MSNQPTDRHDFQSTDTESAIVQIRPNPSHNKGFPQHLPEAAGPILGGERL